MSGGKGFRPTRRGYDPFETISALGKAIRRSQVSEAVYFAVELNESGYANWAWRRMRVHASEDIGHAEPGLPADLRALYENWLQDRKTSADNPDGLVTVADLYLVHAAILCATARKSRLVDWALTFHKSDHVPRLEIPDEALDGHTRRGKQMGRGIPHFMGEGTKLIDLEEAGVDLEELEERYRDELNKRVAAGESHPFRGDPDAPNPWPERGGAPKPAQNRERGSFGQLRMTGDTEEGIEER